MGPSTSMVAVDPPCIGKALDTVAIVGTRSSHPLHLDYASDNEDDEDPPHAPPALP